MAREVEVGPVISSLDRAGPATRSHSGISRGLLGSQINLHQKQDAGDPGTGHKADLRYVDADGTRSLQGR
jgi:hypothetical protein